MPASDNVFTVSQFVATVNQILEYSVPFVRVGGEVSNFRISQGKWVSFRLKDEGSIVECFMGAWHLRTPIEDGMTVVVTGNPRLSGKWGKFSISVQSVVPEGEGAHKRAYELLKKKLTTEGLFAAERKRPLPRFPVRIGLISSKQAAGYGDFIKIVGERWPLAELDVAHVAVQGATSADSIVRALEFINSQAEIPDVIAVVRGGGSSEDLASFNDELLVRSIAASRVPVVVGVGHEMDETLATLAADIAASTPSNAAELIVPDQKDVRFALDSWVRGHRGTVERMIERARVQLGRFNESMRHFTYGQQRRLDGLRQRLHHGMTAQHQRYQAEILAYHRLLTQLHPKRQLERGFALVRRDKELVRQTEDVGSGDWLSVELSDGSFDVEVQ